MVALNEGAGSLKDGSDEGLHMAARNLHKLRAEQPQRFQEVRSLHSL